MRTKDLVRICTEAIPEKIGCWQGEQYGAYNLGLLKNVKRALYCVTPTPEVVSYFKQKGYDILISHHPFRVTVPQLIFHTALDCCEGGLNDMWRDHLGIKNAQHFDSTLGWHGQIDPIAFDDLLAKVREFSGQIIGEVYSRLDTIESVVVCSGLGGLVVDDAFRSGADCYIFGEGMGRNTKFEASIEIGHTLSERMGVELFRKLLQPHGVQVDLVPLALDYFSSEIASGYADTDSDLEYDDYNLTPARATW